MHDIKLPIFLLVFLLVVLFIFINFSHHYKDKSFDRIDKKYKIENHDKKNKFDTVKEEILSEVNLLINDYKFHEALNKLIPYESINDHRIMSSLGYCYAGIKDFSSAIKYFEKAFEIANSFEYGYSIAYLNEFLLNYQKAFEYYTRLENSKVSQEDLYKVLFGKARCLYNLLLYDKAKQVLQEIIKKYPRKLDSYIYLFRIALFTSDYSNLEQILMVGDQHLSNSFLYNFYAGLSNYYANKLDQAYNYFSRALKLEPQNSLPCFYIYKILRNKNISLALKELYKFYTNNTFTPYVLFEAALEAHKEGNYEYAYKFYRTAVILERELLSREDSGLLKDIEKKYINNLSDEVEKQFFIAFKDFVYGDLKSSFKKLNSLKDKIKDKKLKEDFDRIYYVIDVELYKQNKYNEYIEMSKIQQQLALAELKRRLANEKRSSFDTNENSLENLIDELKRKALSQPNNLKLQYKTALELAKLGDLEGAKLFLKETLRIKPDLVEAYYSLAKLYLTTENLFEAEINIEEALKKAPNHTQSLSLASIIYFKKGDINKAQKKAEEALIANPNNYEARLVLAKILLENDPSQAIMHINYLEYQNIDNKEIKYEIDSLKKKILSSN